MEIRNTTESGRGLRVLAGRFGRLDAALLDQKTHQAAHRVIVGVAHQRRRLALLQDEASDDERLDVVRERRGRDLQLVLQAPNGEAGPARAYQSTIDFQPGRITEGFELGGSIVEFHARSLTAIVASINRISSIIEIRLVVDGWHHID